MTYEPRQQFMPFHMRDKRWACIVAHRRAGKTVACINELLTRAIATPKQDARYAYIAPYHKQAKAVAWDYLKRYGRPLITKIMESELQVELLNGARIRLYGADNADALRGLYLDGTILDEYADMRPSIWGTIIRPMLADRGGWAVFIGTPKGHNEFYDVYKKSLEKDDWFTLILRASESGLLAQKELDDSRRDMSEDQYEQEFECSFEAAILGAIYGRHVNRLEKDGRIRHNLYDPSLPVHTAWDLGLTDATAIWFWQVVRNEIRLIDYFEGHGNDISFYCHLLNGNITALNKLEATSDFIEKAKHIKKQKYNYGKHFVPHDAANKTLQAGGRSIVEQAFKHKIKMHIVPATSQANQIEAARQTLRITWIDPVACKYGVEALKQYQYEYCEDKKVFKTKPRHDWTSHGADAFEIIGQVWKNPKQLENLEQPRFLEDMSANDVFWPKTNNTTKYERI